MTCEICGCEDADKITDPYIEGMQGVRVEMYLCSECYKERRDNV